MDKAYALIAVVLLGAAAVVWVQLYGIVDAHRFGFAVDFNQYQDHATRWLNSGQFYLPRQLAGPTAVQDGDPLYPPIVLYLLLPFRVLPAILWWAVPLAVIAVTIARLRPRRWTWPILALVLLWPRTPALVYYGNPGMWVDAAIAAGVMFGWPAAFVLLKPSLAVFAPLGIRHRSWWLALAALGIACVPFGSLWVDYVTVLRNSAVPIWYSLPDLPLALAPVVAWLGRSDPSKGIAPPWRLT